MRELTRIEKCAYKQTAQYWIDHLEFNYEHDFDSGVYHIKITVVEYGISFRYDVEYLDFLNQEKMEWRFTRAIDVLLRKIKTLKAQSV